MNKMWLLVFSILFISVPDGFTQDIKTVSYDEFVEKISSALPELKGNEIDLLSAENAVRSARSGADTKVTADGQYSSVNQYSGRDTGQVKQFEYSAGISKKIFETGTEISTTAGYEKTRYEGFSSSNGYSTHTPSVSLKVNQPVLYNFLGKVDSFSEKDAKMKATIARITLSETNKSTVTAYKKAYFQWVLYREIIDALNVSIQNSKRLRDQTARNARSGLSEDDDYQRTVSSLLGYEAQREEYLTRKKTLEGELGLYIDSANIQPDKIIFDRYAELAQSESFGYVDFTNTNSSAIMNLTLERLAYSKGISMNKMLPELDLFAQIAQKNMTTSSSDKLSSLPYRDYSVGFTFTYSLEGNASASELESINLQITSVQLERESTRNGYQKKLLGIVETANGYKTLLRNYTTTLESLNRRHSAEKRKYSQGRIQLSDIIETENSIASKNVNILSLRYQSIANYIDYLDIIK